MTELEKYEAVNKCETLEQLETVLRSFGDKDGIIKGRTKDFNVDKMIQGGRQWYEDRMWSSPNTYTREYGLRQQLMYLKYYKAT